LFDDGRVGGLGTQTTVESGLRNCVEIRLVAVEADQIVMEAELAAEDRTV